MKKKKNKALCTKLLKTWESINIPPETSVIFQIGGGGGGEKTERKNKGSINISQNTKLEKLTTLEKKASIRWLLLPTMAPGKQ